MEGGAARHRLQRVELARADRVSERRRRGRGVGGDEARRRSSCITSIPSGCGSSTTGSTWSSTARGPIPASWRNTGSAPTRRSCCSWAASPARRASSIWSTRSGTSAPGLQIVLCAGRAGHAGDRRRDDRGGRTRARPESARHHLDPGDAAQGADDRALHARGDLRLSLGLRAVRDHQPGGDGVRDAGRRVSGRRHSRGRRAWRDRAARHAGSDQRDRGRAAQPEQFSRDLAAAVNVLLDDPRLRASMAAKARERVERQFSWTSIARQTLEFYQELVAARREKGVPWVPT